VLLTVASYIQVNTLNAYHRIKALALCGAWGRILGALFAIIPILIWGRRAVVPAVVMAAAGGWLASNRFLKKEVGRVNVRASFRGACAGARSLLKIGVPYIGSVALSKGASLVLPIVVVHMLGTAGVGYYRAASAVAVTYLGFLITAMSQDYFPRISAVSHNLDVLRHVVNEQQRLVLLLAVPMILGMLAVVPYAVPLVYSPKFRPAIELLEWSLIGDVFRLSSLTISIVILARCSGKALLFTEALLAVSTLGTSWLGIRWFGLPGLGMAFLLTYVIYYVAAWVIVRRETGLRFSRSNVQLLWAAISAAVLVRVLPYTPLAAFRTPVALALAAVASVWSLAALSREVGEIEGLAPFQRALSSVTARLKTAIRIP
jgi:PST family polysaccharide transporter